MATTNKTEKIIVSDNDKVIELKGEELELFLQQREEDKKTFQKQLDAFNAQKAIKISAYTKLGLTEEELASIL